MKKILLVLSFFLLLSCGKKENLTGASDRVEDGELAGHLYFEDGSEAEDAVVELFVALEDDSVPNLYRIAGIALESVEADKDGRYSFKDLSDNTYIIAAMKVQNGDTLVAYRFNLEFESSLYAGADTLFEQGKAKTEVQVNGKPREGVECFVPGTSLHAMTDDAGICVISGLVPGSYDISYWLARYLIETESGVDVTSGGITDVGVVELEADPSQPPPEPDGLSAIYDPDSGVVYLSWNPVQVSDMDGYILYKDDTTASNPTRLSAGLVTDTVYHDTVFTDLQDTATVAYRYRIRARDESGDLSGYVEFADVIVTPPNKPSMPFPKNDSTGVGLSPILFWTGITAQAGENVLYNVYLDTNSSADALFSRGLSGTYVSLSNLEDDRTYYWRVVAVIDGKENPGPVWSFTTMKAPDDNDPPFVPSNPSPQDSAVKQSAAQLLLSWSGGDNNPGDLVSYDVYMDTEELPSVKIATGLTDTSFSVTGLQNSTDYYWRVVASDGKETKAGPVWKFSTISKGSGNNEPNKPSGPSPADSAVNQELTVTLSWTGGDPDTSDTVTYTLFFGTNSDPANTEASGLTDTSYEKAGLKENTTYYWKIVASDGRATAMGDIWRFITKAPPPDNKPPYTPSSPQPGDSAADQELSLILSWKGGDPDQADSVTYIVKFGTSNPPAGITSRPLDSTSFQTPVLKNNTRYYWFVQSSDGKEIAEGPVWSFTTIPNRAPVLTNPGDTAMNEGQDLKIVLKASDPDGHNLTYTAPVKPEGAVLTGDLFSWTPDHTQSGAHTVRFVVTDDGGPVSLSDTAVIKITVKDVNVAPQFSGVKDTTIDEGQYLSFTISASDFEGNNLTYAMSVSPIGASLANQVFSWAPGYEQSGGHMARFIVTDDGNPNMADTVTIIITVNDVTNSDLMAWWDFNDGSGTTLTDLTGRGNHGTLVNGPAWTTGIVNGALRFDGDGEYVRVPNSPDLNFGQGVEFSISLWAKSNGTDPEQHLLSKRASGGYQLWFQHNYTSLRVDETVGPIYDTRFNAPFDNQWHHIVAMREANRHSVWIDGVQQAVMRDTTHGDLSDPIDLSIGAEMGWDPSTMTGVIDELKIYRRALSAAEIAGEWNTYKARATLAGYWDFNDGMGTILSDRSVNGNHGTINGATWTTGGIEGGALDFNGRDNHVIIPPGAGDNYTAITMAAWINPRAEAHWHVLDKGDGDKRLYAVGTNLTLEGRVRDNPVHAAATSVSNTVALNTWQHVAMTWSMADNTVRVYHNGAEVSYASQPVGSGNPLDDTTYPFFIGARGNLDSVTCFPGLIDEARLYNRVLSAQEIAAEWDKYREKASLLVYYDFNEGSGTTITDKSIYGHDATINGATWTAGGIEGGALDFNGTDNYVDGADIDFPSGPFTISGWFKTTTTNGGVLIHKISNFQNQNYYIFANTNRGGVLAGLWDGTAWQEVFTDSSMAFNDGIWHQAVMVVSTTDLELFVDGTSHGTASHDNSFPTNDLNFNLGRQNNGSSYFQGQIDELRIYNRSLSAPEVQALYSQSATVVVRNP